jgi:hypothetical protein
VAGTLPDPNVYAARPRRCDLGYLRVPYERAGAGHGDVRAAVGYRCPAEPVEDFVRKGGAAADAVGRKCLCNALTATVGLGQSRPGGYLEPPLATLGTDLAGATDLLRRHPDGWSAGQAIDYLLA